MTNKFIQRDLDAEKAAAEKISLPEQQQLSNIYISYMIEELNECKEYVQVSQQESNTMIVNYEYTIDTLIAGLRILENQTLHQLQNAINNLHLSYKFPVQCGSPLTEVHRYINGKDLYQSNPVWFNQNYEYHRESFEIIGAFVEKMLGELAPEL
jgi:hypothetical protein